MRAAVAAAAAALLLAGPAQACCKRTHLIPPGKQAGEVPLAVGDSVMMGAAPELAAEGVEVDAKEGRVMHAALEILRRRRHVHTLPATVVLAIGTNIPVTTGELARAAHILGDERMLVLVTPLRGWQPFATAPMWRAKQLHPRRIRIADWAAAASVNAGWLWGDGTHLRPEGARAYAALVRAAILSH